MYLPPPEPPISMSQNLPSTKGLQPKMFVLVLNASKETAWKDLTAKVSHESFLSWKTDENEADVGQAEVFRKAWKAIGGV